MNKLENYCKLVINSGINIQKGQTLYINSPVECAYITRILSEEAFKSGAGDVLINWNDEKSGRIRYLNGSLEIFEYRKWDKLRLDEMVKLNAAFLSISSSDPEILKGVDTEKIIKFSKSAAKATQNHKKAVMEGHVQWCIMAVPSEAWAKKVFPNEKKLESAIEKLWDAIYMASRVDENDAVENWKRHSASFHNNAKTMNKHAFKSLILKNSLGTNLEIGLAENHIWAGGGDTSTKKVPFLPNIPTEELFTAPDKNFAEGVVYGSMPLVYQGNLIEDFVVWFEKGKVVKVQAKKNQDLLEKLISTFEDGDRLGEVALVPYDSPISKSGILFYNTLFDENASCHLAFGQAYPSCVKDGVGKSKTELKKAGLNVSDLHHDFMIGTKDMEIIGVKRDGKKVQVFRDGNFVI